MNIYVGNLPYSTTEDALRDLFSQHGNVSTVKMIIDKFSGKSKGFAFVEMTNDDEASAAIEALHGQQMDGRTIIVNQARAREEGGDRRPSNGPRSNDRFRGGNGGSSNGGGSRRF